MGPLWLRLSIAELGEFRTPLAQRPNAPWRLDTSVSGAPDVHSTFTGPPMATVASARGFQHLAIFRCQIWRPPEESQVLTSRSQKLNLPSHAPRSCWRYSMLLPRNPQQRCGTDSHISGMEVQGNNAVCSVHGSTSSVVFMRTLFCSGKVQTALRMHVMMCCFLLSLVLFAIQGTCCCPLLHMSALTCRFHARPTLTIKSCSRSVRKPNRALCCTAQRKTRNWGCQTLQTLQDCPQLS